MKIRADLPRYRPQDGVVTRNLPAGGHAGVNVTGAGNFSESRIAASERTMQDALRIAQTSQAIIQKAMNVSSRLRSIASQAITTGEINTEKLRNAMTSVNMTLDKYGESVAAPVKISSVLRDNFKQLGGLGEEIMSGNQVDTGEFDRVDTALVGEMVSVERGMIDLLESGNTNLSLAGTDTASDFTKKTAVLIEEDPSKALIGQGNVLHENVTGYLK